MQLLRSACVTPFEQLVLSPKSLSMSRCSEIRQRSTLLVSDASVLQRVSLSQRAAAIWLTASAAVTRAESAVDAGGMGRLAPQAPATRAPPSMSSIVGIVF